MGLCRRAVVLVFVLQSDPEPAAPVADVHLHGSAGPADLLAHRRRPPHADAPGVALAVLRHGGGAGSEQSLQSFSLPAVARLVDPGAVAAVALVGERAPGTRLRARGRARVRGDSRSHLDQCDRRGRGPPAGAQLRRHGDLRAQTHRAVRAVEPASCQWLSEIGYRYLRWSDWRGETFSPYLGFVGAAGLLWMLAALVRSLLAQRRRWRPAYSLPAMWILIFSTVGGVNSILAFYFGLDIFRASNRYSIFLLALALLFVVARLSLPDADMAAGGAAGPRRPGRGVRLVGSDCRCEGQEAVSSSRNASAPIAASARTGKAAWPGGDGVSASRSWISRRAGRSSASMSMTISGHISPRARSSFPTAKARAGRGAPGRAIECTTWRRRRLCTRWKAMVSPPSISTGRVIRTMREKLLAELAAAGRAEVIGGPDAESGRCAAASRGAAAAAAGPRFHLWPGLESGLPGNVVRAASHVGPDPGKRQLRPTGSASCPTYNPFPRPCRPCGASRGQQRGRADAADPGQRPRTDAPAARGRAENRSICRRWN